MRLDMLRGALLSAALMGVIACGDDPATKPPVLILDMEQAPDLADDMSPDLAPDLAAPDMEPDMEPDMVAEPCAAMVCREPNRGRCEAQGGQAVCLCDVGFVERAGQCVPADPCAMNPCQEPGRTRCEAAPGDERALCLCDVGLVEQGGRCVPADLCEPNPCQEANRSTCRVGANNTVICSCDPGFRDDGQGACVADVVCGAATCTEQNRSICRAVNGRAVCECDPGFRDNGQGVCVVIDPCAANPCVEPNRGVCSVGANNTAICACDPGFAPQGGQCVPEDPCTNNPCMAPNRGVCTTQGGQALCGCDMGFVDQGGLCVPADPCQPNPCTQPNRGVCSAQGGQAVCGCDVGYQPDANGGCAMIPAPSCANQHMQGDMYEPDECPALATLIASGEQQTHQILPAGDRDFLRFDARAGEIFELSESSQLDVVLTFFGQDGTTVLLSQDNPERIRYEFAQAGTYYASVRHYSSSSTGPYTVSLTSLGFDDHGDAIAASTAINVGQTIDGQVETYGDHDYFSFQAIAGRIYRVEELTNADVVLALYDAQGTLITSIDSPEWLQYEFNQGGTYHIRVRYYSTSSYGAYRLALTEIGVDDHSDATAGATGITAGQTLNGQIETYGDHDYFSFQAVSGRIYRIEELTNADVVLALYDAQGTLITSTDSPEWLQYEFNQGGTYYVRVRYYSTSAIGAYSLRLTDLGVDDHGDDVMSATPVMAGQTINGQVETYGDLDYFSFQAVAGRVYRVEELGNADVVLALYDAQGNLIASTDSPEWLQWEAPTSGTYVFRVRYYSSSAIGAYTMRLVDLGPEDHGDTTATATALSAGMMAQQAGQVEVYGDVDVFAFVASAGEIVRLTTTQSPQTVMTLIGSDGTTALRSASNGLIAHKFAQAGTYYVSVRLSSASSIGAYTLTLTREGSDDHADEAADATAMSADGMGRTGSVQFFGDQDWFVFTAAAGKVYSVQIGGFSQARVGLYDATGTTLIRAQTNGTMFPTLTQGTTYRLRVDATSATVLGSYTLTVSD